MTEQEQLRNEETLAALHEELRKALLEPDTNTDPKKKSRVEYLAGAIQQLSHEQTENEKSLTEWNAACMQNEIEKQKVQQSQRQFVTQVGVTTGAVILTGLFGMWLEKGNMATVLPLKTFVRKLEQMVLNPFRH